MEYAPLADVYERLEKESSKLGKTSIISEFLRGVPSEELEMAVLLLQGRVFPSWSDKEVGIAALLMIKTIASSTGFSEEEINRRFNEMGDLGLVVEELVKGRRQSTLFKKTLTLGQVFENLRRLADVEGKGSQNRKFQLVSELIGSAKPREAKYIVRTVLGELRIGVAQGIVRDSIAEAFFPEDKKDAVRLVEWAWFLRGDYGEVACIAREKGLGGLRKVSIEMGRPVQVLLAEKSPSIEEAVKSYERFVLEFKYDGMRVQVHKKGEMIWVYTRKLENVTKQFPDIVEMVKRGVKAESCVIEGEAIVMDSSGRPQPFQFLSQRIQRKYGIEEMVKKMPVQVNLFDVINLDGRDMFEVPFGERRKILEGIIKEDRGRFQLTKQLHSPGLKEAEAFYKEALKAGHEGLIVKNLDALYQPGRRVAGGWLKVKPTMESLDLVIIGGTWGTGKRAGWLGSLILGCRDGEGFLECGMIGTGIKEKDESGGVTFDGLTRLLKPYIESEKGSGVKIKPRVVVEVAYEEIQKSPNYESGYALRFPRVIKIRHERRAEDSDTLERLERLYKMQAKQRV